MKRLLKILLVLFTCFACVGCNKNKLLLLGDYFILSDIFKDKTKEDGFIQNKMSYKKLYFLLDEDGKSIQKKISINKSLNQASEIVISLGIYDLIQLFDFSDKDIKYDTNQINDKLEVVDYYLYNSFYLIKEKTRAKVYVLEQINPLIGRFNNINDYLSYLYLLNTTINDYCDEFGFKFVGLGDVSNYLFDDFSINEKGIKYIEGKINEISTNSIENKTSN